MWRVPVGMWTKSAPGTALDHKVVEGLDAVVFAFPEPALVRAAAKVGVPVRVATGRPLGHSLARHPEGVAQPQENTCP